MPKMFLNFLFLTCRLSSSAVADPPCLTDSYREVEPARTEADSKISS